REQPQPHHGHEYTAADEIPVLEQGELDEGPVGRQRMREEIIETDAGDDELGDDLVGFEPAQLLATVERKLQRTDRDGKRGESEPVEAQLEILFCLVHEDDEAEHGEDAERQID